MKRITLLSFLFFLVANIIFGQNAISKNLKGKIIAASNDVEGVYIYNQTKKKAVISERNGIFEIYISLGDTLLFSSVTFKKASLLITKKEFESQLLLVELEIATNELEEVEVNKYKNLNAVSLGILEKPAKVYTPAERRLKTAGKFKWYSPLLIPVGGMSVDGLINSISGRTKILKEGISIEKKNFALEKLDYLFEDSYYITYLKIPEDYIDGFKYYIVENDEIRDALNKKNKTMAKFLMSGLSIEYLKKINEE